jgi:hypothetical protein
VQGGTNMSADHMMMGHQDRRLSPGGRSVVEVTSIQLRLKRAQGLDLDLDMG